MAWQPYIDNLKAKAGVGEAAIFGKSGEVLSIWARSEGCNPSVDEVQPFTVSESALRSKGVYLDGEKYILLRYEVEDENLTNVHLKKTKKDDSDTAISATVSKTKKNTLIIVKGTKDSTGGQVSTAARDMGKYLFDNGY